MDYFFQRRWWVTRTSRRGTAIASRLAAQANSSSWEVRHSRCKADSKWYETARSSFLPSFLSHSLTTHMILMLSQFRIHGRVKVERDHPLSFSLFILSVLLPDKLSFSLCLSLTHSPSLLHTHNTHTHLHTHTPSHTQNRHTHTHTYVYALEFSEFSVFSDSQFWRVLIGWQVMHNGVAKPAT